MEKFDLDKVKEKFQQVAVKDMPTRLANIARNFFVASWRKQGWDDDGIKPWKESLRRKKKGGSARNRSQTMVQTGTLRRAVQDCVKEVSFERIRFLVDIPYAGYLNDGTERMVARPFMKDSATLDRLIESKIDKTLDEIWK